MWVGKIGLGSLFSVTVKLWRSDIGAHLLVHIWILKLGMHFGFTAQN